MDKEFINCKQEKVQIDKCECDGISLILSTLACICVAFTLMNASFHLYSSEENHGTLSEAVISATKKIEESDAVAAFLGLNENGSEEIY